MAYKIKGTLIKMIKQILHMRKTLCCSSLFRTPDFVPGIDTFLTCFNQPVNMIELGIVSEVK